MIVAVGIHLINSRTNAQPRLLVFLASMPAEVASGAASK